jgi:hypothetical protein
MNIHFYWKERKDNLHGWQWLNRLTLLSHVLVGHKPILWVDGEHPNNKYWINDIKEIEIRNTKDIINTSDFYKLHKSNPRTASKLFSFEIVSQTGEYTADCDAIAIQKWPNQEILLAGSELEYISVGVFKLPKNHPALIDSINNIKPDWGNVKIFTSACRKYNLDNNVPIHWFYPVHWKKDINYSNIMKCQGKFLDYITLPKDCYSYHYYSFNVTPVNITHEWLKLPQLQNSLLKRLSDKIFKDYPLLK